MNVDEQQLRHILREELDTRFDSRVSGFEDKIGMKLDDRFEAFETKLDTKLDKRFADYDSKLDNRFADYDSKLDKRNDNFETKLDSKLELMFARAFGQFTRHFDTRLKEELDPLREMFNQMQNTLAGFVSRIKDDEEERAAMNNQIDRHGRWIGELAKNTNTSLSKP